MDRYQNYHPEQVMERLQDTPLAKTAQNFSVEMNKAFNGGTWDAQHLSNFLSKSHYSNWRGQQRNISKHSEQSNNTHKRCLSTHGDHFFKTTREDKNQSKIGFTPIFPLVSNAPLNNQKDATLSNFFQSTQRGEHGKTVSMRCSPDSAFKYQSNAIKFKATDPITFHHDPSPDAIISGFQKERMNRLIDRRHPHGMTGVDHQLNPQTKYYTPFQETIRIREEPNSGRTFVIHRDWKQKGRSVPPVDEWKQRNSMTIRKFRNENIHGYNILTNRTE